MQTREEWLELKSRIESIVPLESTTIQLGEQTFTWFRVAEPDRLLEAAVADTSIPPEEIDPFWAATWRAALGLDKFLGGLSISGRPIQGTRILELGCGSGQAGTGAAARGALVTMSDAVELALQVAQLNAWPVAANIQFEQLKWQSQRLEQPRFPMIIGSDLVYDPNLFPLLEACARDHLQPDGRVYLSEPHRHTGDHFATWIVEAGWRKKEHDVNLDDSRVPIRVFECWLE